MTAIKYIPSSSELKPGFLNAKQLHNIYETAFNEQENLFSGESLGICYSRKASDHRLLRLLHLSINAAT
jgi:hypothetical protein